MRVLIFAAALAAVSVPALAQQGRPQQQQQPQRQQQQQQPQRQQPQAQPQQQEQAPAPGMFACRTEAEVCYVGVVIGKSQVSVLYTNDPNAEGIEEKPVNVAGADGQPADLTQHNGRVVMLVGEYSAQGGLAKATVIDAAGPLLSFAIKSMLSGSEEEEEEPEPPPPPQRQPQRQQQRR